jgi:DNA-binding NtrC family response regulator/tetratricopeptide (TPR) repeat protein
MQQEFSDSSLKPVATLMRRGRFAEALEVLQTPSPASAVASSSPWLADLLQRTGNNQEAKRIALQALKSAPSDDGSISRCYWVLGNVARELGNASGALHNFQMAAKHADNKSELSCWIQLRLMSTVANIGGSHSAMARLADVRRSLTRFGDARPFAALHLWLAEIDTRGGRLDGAVHHLEIARSLLGDADDVWLQGYLATNSFGVSYYSAQISDARKSADAALDFATISGHAAALRAAHANLGHIEFSLGRIPSALDFFERALRSSERGSPSYSAILDSIAQIRLHSGDLEECEALVKQLDELSEGASATTSDHRAWALQTKLQLLLKQDRIVEAAALCRDLDRSLPRVSEPRVRVILGLLSVETSLAAGDPAGAASRLRAVFSESRELPPDLLAETERVVAKTLQASGSPGTAKINLARAISTYEFIGHAIGRAEAESESQTLATTDDHPIDYLTARTLLDRLRVLIETRGLPELFAFEAADLLRDLNCAGRIQVVRSGRPEKVLGTATQPWHANSHSGRLWQISLTPRNRSGLCLEFLPRSDSAAIVAATTFQKVIERIVAFQSERNADADEIPWLRREMVGNDNVVFTADSMIGVLKITEKVASTNLTVLITGETGTGKEVVAKALHERSDRSKRPFTAFNCAAVPRELLESQLFGYRRGAFSGAAERFEGVIRGASGGTLLMDEIGEIPLEMQPKLLRFLESGEIHPLGESQPTKVDVRLVFATNANLDDLVVQRRFREDLLFRINVIQIKVPPLRDRREEIPLLIDLFSRRFARELGRPQPKFSPETIEHLIVYDWPGNVRQLNNEVRRLLAMNEDGDISPDDISADIRKGLPSDVAMVKTGPSICTSLNQHLSRAVEQLERTMLEHALSETNGRIADAAKRLGLSRKGLYLKRQRLGMLEE